MRTMVFAALMALSAVAQEIPAGWFPFQTDARVAPADSLGSVAFLNQGPANQRISLKDGHFALPDGSRIRFFGTNVTFERAFPDKEVAPLVAKRMRQLGFNVVRFHHMDNCHIWNADQTAFDPERVDRLQWFIHCLNQEGIYVNINLHVSRWYKGLSHKSAFHYGKALDRFYPPFIAQQKEYAQALLTAVSPYSKLPMTDDPGVFCIEINNENPIDWLGDPYKLAELPGTPWGDCLLTLWHGWLARKYGNAPAAVQAWAASQQPLSQTNMVAGMTPHFEGERPGFFEPCRTAEGEYELKLLRDGAVDWAYQMHFFPVTLKEGGHYLARFRIRGDVPRVIHVSLAHAEPPWHNYSSRQVNVTPEWQEVEVQLNVMNMQDVKKRFTLNLQGRNTPATVFVKDIELFEGERPMPFAQAEKFSQIPFPDELAPMEMNGDYRTFLRELDYRYSREMTDFLKDTLKAKALVMDTQASYGGVFGQLRNRRLRGHARLLAASQFRGGALVERPPLDHRQQPDGGQRQRRHADLSKSLAHSGKAIHCLRIRPSRAQRASGGDVPSVGQLRRLPGLGRPLSVLLRPSCGHDGQSPSGRIFQHGSQSGQDGDLPFRGDGLPAGADSAGGAGGDDYRAKVASSQGVDG